MTAFEKVVEIVADKPSGLAFTGSRTFELMDAMGRAGERFSLTCKKGSTRELWHCSWTVQGETFFGSAGGNLTIAVREAAEKAVHALQGKLALPQQDPRPTLSVDEIELSVRAYVAVSATGSLTVGELCTFTKDELLATKGCGPATLREIRKELDRRGYELAKTTQPHPHQDLRAAVGKIRRIAREKKLVQRCILALAINTDEALMAALEDARGANGEDSQVNITAHRALGGRGDWSF